MMYLLQLVKKPSREVEVNEAEFYKYRRKKPLWLPDFPGGPMVKNPPANAGDTSLILAPGGNQVGQLSPCTATTERM